MKNENLSGKNFSEIIYLAHSVPEYVKNFQAKHKKKKNPMKE